MPIQAKFVHTNIVARDWRRFAKFYEEVFGCVPMLPERDYDGEWINQLTASDGHLTIRGIHLRLPGYDDHGPTLEIFEYNEQPDAPPIAANRSGFTHIAFHVDDVPAARQAVLDGGGQDLGDIIHLDVPRAGHISLIYMTDPEGNIIELQNCT